MEAHARFSFDFPSTPKRVPSGGVFSGGCPFEIGLEGENGQPPILGSLCAGGAAKGQGGDGEHETSDRAL